MSMIFNLFGWFSSTPQPPPDQRSMPGDDNRSRNNRFETVKRNNGTTTTASSSSSSSGKDGAPVGVRNDAFKNVKLTPELEATRRRVEEELTVKMDKASEMQEQRDRASRSPMLTSIGNMFGFGSKGDLSSAALNGNGSVTTTTPRSRSAGRPESRNSLFSGFSSEKAPSVSSVRSGRSLASQGGERGVQDAFERIVGTDGLEVTVYLTSREGETKSKRALMKREKNSSTVYVEIKSKPKRPGEKEAAKRLKFDLATDVMMVAKGKGSGRGVNDAKVPRSVDDNGVLHFILKGKPELNVEVDGGMESRDAVLTGFMQLISRHRKGGSSFGAGAGGPSNGSSSVISASSSRSGGSTSSSAFFM